MSGALLSCRSLSAGYPGRVVLSGVDLELVPGELLALIGPNGAGKTTLFRALAGELAPLSGEVLVRGGEGGEGRPIASLGLRERSRLLARVLQSEEAAWPLPVRDYVEAGTFSSTGWFGRAGPAERKAVTEALEAMDLLGLAARPVTELSGGEFRRVLIARALAQSAEFLLLDEPAAELDLARQMETLGRLKDLARAGRAVVFSVHDLNLASLAADRVALLAGGKIVALGSPREVITAESIASTYGARVLVSEHPLGDFPQVLHAPDWLTATRE